jgi:hypothetical protein
LEDWPSIFILGATTEMKRLGHVSCHNWLGFIEIGDCSGHLQHTVEASEAQPQALDRNAQ